MALYFIFLLTQLAMIFTVNDATMQKESSELRIINNENNEGCDAEYSCTNCTTVKICRKDLKGNLTKIREFQCNKDAPYCDFNSGTCVKNTPNVECNDISSDFYCPADGYYPNPSDCKKYFICIKGVAYIGDCGTSFYNVKSENCQYTYTCYTINCIGKSGVKVPYGNDPSFFAYCYNGTILKFDKCPGKFKLDTTTQKCVPTCTQEGYQGDPFNCSKYYKCSYETSSVILTLTYSQCPSNELFDSLNSRCTPKKDGLTCSSGHVYKNGKFIYPDDSKFIHDKDKHMIGKVVHS